MADRNIRGGTVLHESTHAVNDTDDTVYGCSADQELPADFQIDNAGEFIHTLFHYAALESDCNVFAR